jgi:hypothetical protein
MGSSSRFGVSVFRFGVSKAARGLSIISFGVRYGWQKVSLISFVERPESLVELNHVKVNPAHAGTLK